MKWNRWIRQSHRWVSIAFALAVAANFTALGLGHPVQWLYYVPLPPLFFLLFTGLYMFALPYLAKGQTAGGQG